MKKILNLIKIVGIKKFIFLLKNKNKIKISNSDNFIKLGEKIKLKNCNIKIKGKKNQFNIAGNVKIKNNNIIIYGDDNCIEIGEGVIIDSLKLTVLSTQSKVIIKKGTTIGELEIIVAESNEKVEIGENCMISVGVSIRTTDSHPIYDIQTNKRLNFGKDVEIKDNVWIGSNVTILKGVTIERGSVIGRGAMITKNIEENCIAVGNGKIVKRNIRWEKKFRAVKINILNSINKVKNINLEKYKQEKNSISYLNGQVSI